MNGRHAGAAETRGGQRRRICRLERRRYVFCIIHRAEILPTM